VIRGTYGPDQPYTELAARAFELWRSNERKWKRQFLHRIGVLWMAASNDDAWERGSLDALQDAGILYERLSGPALARRWPQINFEDVEWGIFEPESGYLTARVACRAVVEGFVAEGGTYRQAAVLAEDLESGSWKALRLSDGSELAADRYVFACGPWLGELFPKTLSDLIRPTKQDIFFFGPPARHAGYFTDAHMPVWGDHGKRFFYGIPGSDRRGFKMADDTRGAAFDPTCGERVVSQASLKRVRDYMGFRFPAMKEAPLIETRVCQYEQTSDSNFILDRLPGMDQVWILGGGSGHGFKHGPALGETMAELVLTEGEADKVWQLSRFGRR
jgi:glycine/D-amino acid oxidase-like deaminating enzyme